MRVKLPEFKTLKDELSYVKANVKQIISQKRALDIQSDECVLGCESLEFPEKAFSNKSVIKGAKAIENKELSENQIAIKAFANTIGWCDSHMDVLIRDCAKKTISDKGASNQILFYHLKDHNHSTEGIIGKNARATLEDVSLEKFNIKSEIKSTQVIFGHSIVDKEYDKKAYLLYSDNEIKQHSIGLQYVKIFLCINSDEPDDAQLKENWDKYSNQVINKDKIDSKGYFWAVTEIKLLEFSAVLFGSNELTPTEEISKAYKEPSIDTQKDPIIQPSSDTDRGLKKRLLNL